MRTLVLRRTALVLALAVQLAAAIADPGDERSRERHDHDHARHARDQGEVRPVEEILAAATRAVPGEVIGVELEREHGRWVYEVKVITAQGRLLEVLVDGAEASVLEWDAD